MDWAAGILELIGIWIVGNKTRWGFVILLVCGICWLTHIALTGETLGLLAVVPIAMLINVRNFIKWSRDSAKEG